MNLKQTSQVRGCEIYNNHDVWYKLRNLMRTIGYKRARNKFAKKRRQRIMIRDKSTCRYCGTQTPTAWHLDHVIPLSWGGSDWSSNIVLSCDTCNMEKSATVWRPHDIPLHQILISLLLVFKYQDWPKLKDFL